jgi:hypothetical protein
MSLTSKHFGRKLEEHGGLSLMEMMARQIISELPLSDAQLSSLQLRRNEGENEFMLYRTLRVLLRRRPTFLDKFALTTLTELPISNEAVAATAEGVQRNVYLGRKNQPQTNAYREFNDTLRTHAAQMRVLSGRQGWQFVVDILTRPMLANGCALCGRTLVAFHTNSGEPL